MTATALTTMTIECPRCCGRGYMREFAHVAGGRCFLCGGAKTIDLRDAIHEKTGVRVGMTVYKNVKGDVRGAEVYAYQESKSPMTIEYGDGGIEEFFPRTHVWCYGGVDDVEVMRQVWKAWQGTKAELKIHVQQPNGRKSDVIVYQEGQD